MGWYKVIFCQNDQQHDLERDPARWWAYVKNAFYQRERKPQSFPGGYAVCEDHNDTTTVIAVGKGHASILGVSGHYHHTPEDQIKLLKGILEERGYRVVKKSTRKRACQDRSGPNKEQSSETRTDPGVSQGRSQRLQTDSVIPSNDGDFYNWY